MSFLSKLFGSKSTPPSPKDVEGELLRLEAEAEDALPAYVGTAFNRAGDLALRDGQPDRAVGYYGRAIDAFLEDAQREAARGVANKIIRVRPSAVRTLSTLTWLDLAARHHATALLHLRDYASAAAEAGEQKRAATQIHAMARVSDDTEFLDAAADALDSLGFVNRAKEVRSWTRTGAPEALAADGDLGAACLEAAVRSNDPAVVLLDDDVEVPLDPGEESDEHRQDASGDEESATDDDSDDGEPKSSSEESGKGHEKRRKKKR
jgi:tetratricopeptide (TPR) repeat protein